jgi:hypothetical protein
MIRESTRSLGQLRAMLRINTMIDQFEVVYSNIF